MSEGSAGSSRWPSGPWLRRLLGVLIIIGPFAWLFGPVLCTSRSFVFRDAAHYYYPLFAWTAGQWAAGEIPLWNPQENCGVPVLADATSSVFYPGKLLFLLPLDYGVCYKWYVALHVLLAAWSAYGLARHWETSRPAAVLAALSYAFGGSVLFQYCNVVFLVGAAWLPLAVLAADRMFLRQQWRWMLAVAVVWALMVLGGDPQAAYHAALLAGLQLVLHRGSPGEPCLPGELRLRGGLGRKLMLLMGAGGAAALLAAVQILPSWEWSVHSQRAVYESPRSVYEIPGFLSRPIEARGDGSIARGLFGPPDSGRHQEHIYHFSVGPWRLAELVWPNFSGRLFPIHRRWTTLIPAEGRIWTPSLYLGLLPLLLGLASCRWRRGPVGVRWATWAALLGVLSSFGWYGLGWLLHELRYAFGGAATAEAWPGQPVGGLYWLLVTVLPGYAMFRFPAKLFVVATLGLSLLAAFGLDALRHGSGRWLPRLALGLAAASLAAGGATFLLRPAWEAWMQGAPIDPFFGPLDAAGALADLRISLWHAAVLATVLWGLLRLAGGRFQNWVAPLILIITAADLAAAHHWSIPTAPLELWQRPGFFASLIESGEGGGEGTSGFRVYRGSRSRWLPAAWSRTSSRDRQLEGLAWDIDTLAPKYHLQTDLRMVESYGTFGSQDFSSTLRVARRAGVRRPDRLLEPHRGVLDALGTRYLLLPPGIEYPQAVRVDAPRQAAPAEAALWLNPAAFPRAWIVHQVEVLPPLTSHSPLAVERRVREIWFPGGRLRDLKQQAVVEADAADVPALAGLPAADPPADLGEEHCLVTVDRPRQIDLSVRLRQPGLVVLSDLYYPGWTARRNGEHPSMAEAHRVPILRTNRIMRGVWLPAGEHRLSFTYEPALFRVGAVLSGAAWLATAALALVLSRRRG